MIKIGMCDDNINTLQLLKKYLNSEFIEQNVDAEITICTSNQKEIYEKVLNEEIDVLFLDIDFKNLGKNGLEFARDLRMINKYFYLVFLSAHQKYIHLSFNVKVFDYLIKPINREIIQDLVTRLKEEFSENKKTFLRLNKWTSVRIDSIIYIEKLSNKSIIHTKDDEIVSTRTLESLLEVLPANFRKCHRSYILNIDKVYRVDRKSHLVFFTNKMCCPITARFQI